MKKSRQGRARLRRGADRGRAAIAQTTIIVTAIVARRLAFSTEFFRPWADKIAADSRARWARRAATASRSPFGNVYDRVMTTWLHSSAGGIRG